MLEALVVVLREGVEASLIVAIVLAYLKKTGRQELVPWVYAGVGLALLGSVLGAIGLNALHWSSEAFDGYAMLAAAACVVGLVLWMNRAARGLKRHIESHVDAASTRQTGASWGLFAFTAVMILREGVETILFLAATSFTTSGLSELAGGLLGLALAVVFAVFLIRGTLRVDIGKFFRVTTIVLFVLAFQLVVGGLHELSEGGILPASRGEMGIVGPIVRHDTQIFLVVLLFAIALVTLSNGSKTAPAAGAGAPGAPAGGPGAAASAPELRLARARDAREHWARVGALASGLAVVGLLSAGMIVQGGPPPKAPATPVVDRGGALRVPLAASADGHIHYYEVGDPQNPGTKLRFFAIRKPGGQLQACMDACEICGDRGYYEDKGGLTCRNCSAPINLATLGLTGGCNPIPVVTRVEGDSLVVDAASVYAQRDQMKGRK